MAESLEYGRIAFEFLEEVDRLSDPDVSANLTVPSPLLIGRRRNCKIRLW